MLRTYRFHYTNVFVFFSNETLIKYSKWTKVGNAIFWNYVAYFSECFLIDFKH